MNTDKQALRRTLWSFIFTAASFAGTNFIGAMDKGTALPYFFLFVIAYTAVIAFILWKQRSRWGTWLASISAIVVVAVIYYLAHFVNNDAGAGIVATVATLVGLAVATGLLLRSKGAMRLEYTALVIVLVAVLVLVITMLLLPTLVNYALIILLIAIFCGVYLGDRGEKMKVTEQAQLAPASGEVLKQERAKDKLKEEVQR